jgi:acyl-CoA oxidase
MLEISRDPVMYLKDVHDLSKDELRERTMEKIAAMRHYTKEDAKTFARRCQVVGLSDAGFQTRFGVSTGLFLGAVRNGSTEEQWSE